MTWGCASSTELPTILLRGIYDFLEERNYQKKLSIVLRSSELSFTSSQKHYRDPILANNFMPQETLREKRPENAFFGLF